MLNEERKPVYNRPLPKSITYGTETTDMKAVLEEWQLSNKSADWFEGKMSGVRFKVVRIPYKTNKNVSLHCDSGYY
jgi:hypothetical protein